MLRPSIPMVFSGDIFHRTEGQVSELIEGADAAKLAGGNPLQVGLFTVGTANVSPIKGQSPKTCDGRWQSKKEPHILDC